MCGGSLFSWRRYWFVQKFRISQNGSWNTARIITRSPYKTKKEEWWDYSKNVGLSKYLQIWEYDDNPLDLFGHPMVFPLPRCDVAWTFKSFHLLQLIEEAAASNEKNRHIFGDVGLVSGRISENRWFFDQNLCSCFSCPHPILGKSSGSLNVPWFFTHTKLWKWFAHIPLDVSETKGIQNFWQLSWMKVLFVTYM